MVIPPPPRSVFCHKIIKYAAKLSRHPYAAKALAFEHAHSTNPFNYSTQIFPLDIYHFDACFDRPFYLLQKITGITIMASIARNATTCGQCPTCLAILT